MTKPRWDADLDYPASELFGGGGRGPARARRIPPRAEDNRTPEERAADEWREYAAHNGREATLRHMHDIEQACVCSARLADFLRVRRVRAKHWCPKNPGPYSTVPRVYMPDALEDQPDMFVGVNHVDHQCQVYTAPEYKGFLDRTLLATSVRQGLYDARVALQRFMRSRYPTSE